MSSRLNSCKKACWSYVAGKIAVPAGRGREMIESIQQGLKDDGVDVPITELCDWFGALRRTVYYKPVKKSPIVRECFA